MKNILLYPLLFASTLLVSYKVQAQIPSVTSGNYSVPSGSAQNCTTDCIISSGDTLFVNPGATARFNGNLTISDNAVVIVNGAIIRMNADKRIILKSFNYLGGWNGMTPPPFSNGARLFSENNALFTSFSSSVSGTLWAGIDVQTNWTVKPNLFVLGNMTSKAVLNNTTIELAQNALNNYNTLGNSLSTAEGSIKANTVKFKNNKRSLGIYHAGYTATSIMIGVPDSYDEENVFIKFTNCLFSSDANLPFSIPHMVYINGSKAIPFASCKFEGNETGTGILGINSGIKITNPSGNKNDGYFKNLEYGISLTNGLQSDRRLNITNTTFYTSYGINLSGCQKPRIINNGFLLNGSNEMNIGIYMNNCSGFKVEGNEFKGHPYGDAGIVIKNSGTAYNEIYRNNFPGYPIGMQLSIQSIGRNRDANALTGLKIFCNEIKGLYTGYDISVMENPSPMLSYNGIANIQAALDGNSTYLSVGNKFSSDINSLFNFYLEPETNIDNDFEYYYYYNANEFPTFRNFTHVLLGDENTCPVKNTVNPTPQFPRPDNFKTKLFDIENQMEVIERKPKPILTDTLSLDRLYTRHAQLIDSMIDYFYYTNDIDSIHWTYEQTTKAYHNKIHLALSYAGQNKYNEATALLNNLLIDYLLIEEEEHEIEHIVNILKALQWLDLNHHDWESMPASLKEYAYDYHAVDPMYAGAIARSLLASYEGKAYIPEYILPDTEEMPVPALSGFEINSKERIYPNPAKEYLHVSGLNHNAIFMLTDITGKVILRKKVEAGNPIINISTLSSGIYIASLKEEENTETYQQKIIIK